MGITTKHNLKVKVEGEAEKWLVRRSWRLFSQRWLSWHQNLSLLLRPCTYSMHWTFLTIDDPLWGSNIFFSEGSCSKWLEIKLEKNYLGKIFEKLVSDWLRKTNIVILRQRFLNIFFWGIFEFLAHCVLNEQAFFVLQGSKLAKLLDTYVLLLICRFIGLWTREFLLAFLILLKVGDWVRVGFEGSAGSGGG